jgi:hypothetical protein
MNIAEIISQQSAARDGKQRGGFSKVVLHRKFGGISKVRCSEWLPPLSRSVKPKGSQESGCQSTKS